MTGEQLLLQVHPVQRCDLLCHLLTCHILQKGHVKIGRLYRWRTGEVLGQILGELKKKKKNYLKIRLIIFQGNLLDAAVEEGANQTKGCRGLVFLEVGHD